MIITLFLLKFTWKGKKQIGEMLKQSGPIENVRYSEEGDYTVLHVGEYRKKTGEDPSKEQIRQIHEEIGEHRGLLKQLRETEMTYGRRLKEAIGEGRHQVMNTINQLMSPWEAYQQRRRIKAFRKDPKKDAKDIAWIVTGRAQNKYGGGRAMRKAEESEGRVTFYVGPGKAYQQGPEAAGKEILKNMVDIYKKTGVKPESFRYRTDIIRPHSSGVNAVVHKLKEIREKTGVKYVLGMAGDPYGSHPDDKPRIGTYAIGKMIDLEHESTSSPKGRKTIIKLYGKREKYTDNPIRYDAAAGLGDELVKIEDAYDPQANKFYVIHGGKEHQLHTGHFAQASDLETNLLLSKIASKGLEEVKKELKQEHKYREREYKKAA